MYPHLFLLGSFLIGLAVTIPLEPNDKRPRASLESVNDSNLIRPGELSSVPELVYLTLNHTFQAASMTQLRSN